MAVGREVSATETVKAQVAVLPDPSVVKNAVVVVPTGKLAPLANPLVCVTGKVVAQLSVANTEL